MNGRGQDIFPATAVFNSSASVMGGQGVLVKYGVKAASATLTGGITALSGTFDTVGVSTITVSSITTTGAGVVFSTNVYFTNGFVDMQGNILRGLTAPLTGDAAATKTYVDAILDICALGSAGTADIVAGKNADIDCDGVAEAGAMAAQTLAVSTDEVKAGVYSATWLSAVDADLAAANIRSGSNIFGKVGTFTSGATAAEGDIVSGKTAGVNGAMITGTLTTQTLNPANDTVNEGVYAATTLHAVDADLAAGNIAVSTIIFGITGTYTGDADATAADILNPKTAYVSGVKLTGSITTQSLSAGSNNVAAGGYVGTTLSEVDADLAAGNIKSGTAIFGITGTLTTAPPAPGVGGTWLLVPGNSSLGTMDFYVQKYEAKNVSSLPTSQPSGFPWVSITQTEAKNRCEALGPGYHLLTMQEAQTISRNIEAIGWNWDSGSVGTGGMWRGHTDNSPANSLAADVTGDPDDDYYIGTGNTTPSIERRVHQLSSSEYIWDWSGNVMEWVDMTCTAGTGAGYWYNSATWIEWTDGNLSDYEKVRAGPSGAYIATHNAGRYYGCTTTGNAVGRGGVWSHDASAGVFTFDAYNAPSYSDTHIGFRCGR
ncbi:MAG TPA: hypothetical protein DCS63_02565 [Elusimicrobia bacterium]|nr:hypothetical protein [Elusimicrobiota bacterium]